MNRDDIDDAVSVLSRRKPEIAPYARYLAAWRDVVDDNSDGWPYWKQGHQCADRLMRLLRAAIDVVEGRKPREDMPKDPLFRSALTPIKRMASRRGFPSPEFEPFVPAEDAAPPAPGMR